jgi:valyl-tRNA synthetase
MQIPSRYNPREVEPKILSQWLSAGVFSAGPNPQKKPFCIVIPPPNITGILHMGHALNNTIQDVLIRYKRMQGFEAFWMPGTDHAGIATQNVVEKQLAKEGLGKEDIGRDAFIERLWEWKKQYGSTIIEQLKRLGASCDWSRTRFTMDEGYSRAVEEVFIRLYEKGLIYRGNYIINWCPRCRTALSDEEAAHKEIDGWLYYIRYPVRGHKVTSHKSQVTSKDYIVVATTRPETMLGDTAVAINPKDKRFAWLKEAEVILPIAERRLRVIEDEAVDPEFGTGIVKVTPAHDPVDFMLGKKHDLEFLNIMNEDATLNQNVPDDFIGMDRFQARQALLEVLEEKELIEKKEPYKISAGHCYRCHTIIEPRISLQWFVKMKPLAEPAIKVVEEGKITFYPERWKKVYLNWMHNIQDWCISRQIWWGHRLPVWQCKCQTGENSNFEFRNSKLAHQGQGNFVVSREKPQNKCPRCNAEYEQAPDVLDTWFSSWLWPFATFYWPFLEPSAFSNQPSADKDTPIAESRKLRADLGYFYPTDCLVTASEILFFWVARMIMAGMEFMGQIPFRDVLIHGTVRDERGIKMSKSLGNIIDPLQIIDTFGADALRFSLMLSASSGSDVFLNEERFLVGRNFCNKIWNATRFILLKLRENNITVDDLEIASYDEIDSWLFEELEAANEAVAAHLDAYCLNEAAKRAYDFFWHVFCDWYIEIVKDNVTLERAKVLLRVLLDAIKLLHPIVPYITEEVFSLFKKEYPAIKGEFLTVSAWPAATPKIKKCDTARLRSLLDTIRALRNIKIDLGLAQKKVGLEVCFHLKPDKESAALRDFWETNLAWVCRLSGVSGVTFRDELSRRLYESNLWAFDFEIEKADLKVFISSLEKKLANLNSVLEKVNARLDNPGFLEKASEDLIEKEKIKQQDISDQLRRLERLKNALA